ncbi:MAG: hypothetical protein BA871_16890 [Desulfuromonadales bacterium C00003096]|jgi:Flp pilus assembly protein TadD|nr:MAG: hypothetical protein BA871_16890 [Desulfuromonadales bacterium C00003096]
MNRSQKLGANNFLIKTALLLLLLLLLPGCSTKTQYPSMTRLINANEMPKENDAIHKMSNLSHDQLIKKADIYLQNNNYRLAKLHYQKALGLRPHSIAASIGLSKLLIQDNSLKEATQVLEKAIEGNPGNLQALVLLGATARQQGDLNASLTWLSKAYEQNPQDPEILTELAITNDHIGQERLTYAEPLYRKVVSLRPNSSAAHNNLGFNYLLQGLHQDAIKAFSKALSLAPNNDRAKNNLAAAYLLAQEPDKALRLFQDTVGLAAAYNNLGYIHMTLGDQQQAEKAFKKALQINPSFYVRAQHNMERLNQN